DMVAAGLAIAVCPEEMGGLSTPRSPAEKSGPLVITKDGVDVSAQYRKGAELALEQAIAAGCSEAHLKSLSPMCGVGEIYDGSFSGGKIEGDGVFTELLRQSGITPVRID